MLQLDVTKKAKPRISRLVYSRSELSLPGNLVHEAKRDANCSAMKAVSAFTFCSKHCSKASFTTQHSLGIID